MRCLLLNSDKQKNLSSGQNLRQAAEDSQVPKPLSIPGALHDTVPPVLPLLPGRLLEMTQEASETL